MQTIDERITIATAGGRYFFSPKEIVRLEASSNYTNIFFTNHKKMLSATVLKKFATLLEPMGFVRTHRTHLVNRQYIHCVSQNGNIIMKDASLAEISRRKRAVVMKLLGAS